jgi:two-component system, OmpR family, response regulator VicR
MKESQKESSLLIVVMDDDHAYLRLMERLLTSEGYQVLPAHESSQAHELVRRELPSLVITDLRLQNPDAGMELVELIRLDPETTSIPILVCSADSQFLREKGESLREKRCETLEKPFDLDELLAKVKATMKLA